MPRLETRERIAESLAATGYIADPELATALLLMEMLERPLLIEGAAGVGKTAVAYALAALHEARLIRLQCYEGLDQASALYEWNYQRQLLAIKAREGEGGARRAEDIEDALFSERYLLERPLLAAIREEKRPVLLIDEIDRADEEFEAFLLELLSDFQVSIPELGTIRARSIPRVVLTSIIISTIPRSTARWRSSAPVCPPSGSTSRARSRACSPRSARSSSEKSRAWPRASTGRPRCSGSASAISPMHPRRSTRPSSAC